jgi:hypothetical protein
MNSLMITPIGIGIIGIYSAIVGVVLLWPLFRLLRNSRWKLWIVSIVGLPILAAPWAEEAWIAWHFNEACKDAGVKVYRQVEVDGFYDDTMPSGYELIARYGYKFMEHRTDDGKVKHIEKFADQWQIAIVDRPTARYHFKHAYQPTRNNTEESIGWKLLRAGTLVVDSQTNDVVGRSISYIRLPSVADWQWIRFFGGGGHSCPDQEKGPHQPPFPQSVFIPLNKQ